MPTPLIVDGRVIGSVTDPDVNGNVYYVIDQPNFFNPASVPGAVKLIDSGFSADRQHEALIYTAQNLRQPVTQLPAEAAGLHWYKDRLYAAAPVAYYVPPPPPDPVSVGVVWNVTARTVSVFDPASDAVSQTIAVTMSTQTLGNLYDIRLSDDGAYAYVISRSNSALYEVDIEAGTATQIVAGLTDAVALEVSGSFAYVLCGTIGRINKVNLTTRTIASYLATDGNVSRCVLSPDGSVLYVASVNMPLEVRKIATATMTELARSTVMVISPTGMALNADGSRLYVGGEHPNDPIVRCFNTADMSQVAASSQLNGLAQGVAAHGGYVYAIVHNTGTTYEVVKLDGTTLAEVGQVNIGNAQEGQLAFSPDKSKLYATISAQGAGDDTFAVIDVATLTVSANVTVGDGPSGIAVL